MLQILVVLGLIASAWYLLIVRPQRDRHGHHTALVSQLAPGTHVMTVGGIYGRVTRVEGSTVVIEIAPGMESRVAVDGIARIAQGSEAVLSAQPQHSQEHHMQHEPQHPHIHHDAPALPQPVVPQQPFAQQHVPHPTTIPAATAPVHVPGITMRASIPQPQVHSQNHPAAPAVHISSLGSSSYHVEPSPPNAALRAPVWSPRPWKAPGIDTELRVSTQPVDQRTSIELPALPPAPYAVPQSYAAPQQYVAPQAYPAPHIQAPGAGYGVPVHAYAPAPAHTAPVYQPVPAQQPVQPLPEEPQRRHSKAPDGMGSSVKLSDPKLRDQVVRARREREELADEYQRLLAPYVAEQQTAVPVSPYVQPAAVPAGPQHLFAHGQTVAAPVSVFPSPAIPPHAGEISHHAIPGVGIPHDPHPAEAAFDHGAFQRSAPYSAQPAS